MAYVSILLIILAMLGVVALIAVPGLGFLALLGVGALVVVLAAFSIASFVRGSRSRGGDPAAGDRGFGRGRAREQERRRRHPG